MKISHKTLSIALCILMMISVFADNTASAASSTRYAVTEVDITRFTESETILAGLQKVITDYPVAFTKDGKTCSKSHSGGEDNCLWFTPHQNYSKHNSRSTQCFGYANYVYETIFGEYWGFSQYFSSDNTLGSTTTGEKVRSEFERLGVSLGTIVRSFGANHSFVVLDHDEDGVWIIHANYAGSNYGGCNTSIYYYPWSTFAKAYGQLGYIIIPDSICEKCTYTLESFPVCTVCTHRIGIYEDMYASYTVTSDTPEYFIPFEGGQTEEMYTTDSEVIITGLFNVNETAWAITEDGKYIMAENILFSDYLPSMTLSGAKYPDDYIVKGKSFWLQGTLSSKNKISSLTLQILNEAGEVIDKNTITPDMMRVNVADADNLKFSRLGKGYYTFRLIAADAAEEKEFISSPFRVISDTTIKEAFPDKIFRQYVKTEIIGESSTGDSGYADLYDDIFSKVTEIDVSALGISTLGEIHRFENLISLDASYNHMTELDLSKLIFLETVDVSSQSVGRQAEYSHDDGRYSLTVGNADIVYYSRPCEFPRKEVVEVQIGYGDILMDITVDVTADTDVLSDVNGDGCVNSDDLSAVLCEYGTEVTGVADVTYDGKVNKDDLSKILGMYGKKFTE
ncbi:MAG: dockerin type I repeat-containing protein [Eubacteriaceae bacterium]|nr:dockerin type I repeat-containing protein [Eubacteriaceae bacterium]